MKPNMEITKSKKGRPATGRAFDGKVFMRLPKELEGRAKEAIRELISKKAGVDTNQASKGLESKGMGGLGGSKLEVAGGEVLTDPYFKGDVEKVPKYGYEGAAGFQEAAEMSHKSSTPITMEQLPLLKQLAEKSSQLAEMTRCYEEEFKRAENLVIDLANAQDEINNIASWTEDDKTKYWRNRALMAEQQLKGKTNEFDQG